ncbi:Uncharacterised protein [Mammaliicoccus sciuri]|nr:Uncharacterised protein [Mammaliicoccus sciuri]
MKLKVLKLTLLIIILAEEIRSVSKLVEFYLNTKACPICSSRVIGSANYCTRCRHKFN